MPYTPNTNLPAGIASYTTFTNQPTSIVYSTYDNCLYWTIFNSNLMYKYNLTTYVTTTITLPYSGYIYNLAIKGNYIYYVYYNSVSSLYQVDVTTAIITSCTITPNNGTYSINYNSFNDTFYLVMGQQGSFNYISLNKCNISTTGITNGGTITCSSTFNSPTYNGNTLCQVWQQNMIAFDSNNLYISVRTSAFNNGAGLLQVPYDSSGNITKTVFTYSDLFIDASGIGISPFFFNNLLYVSFGSSFPGPIRVYNTSGTVLNNNYVSAANYLCTMDIYKSFYFFGYSSNTYTLYICTVYLCFKEDTEILTMNGYKLIQNLRKGDLVKTVKNGYVPIYKIGFSETEHPRVEERIKEQLYKCSPDNYPEVFEDLVLTGCHNILVDLFYSEKQGEKAVELNGHLCITDDKYRLPVCLDEKATVYDVPGKHTIYHMALENDDYFMNYGIYANGLLVESTSKRFMDTIKMTLIE